MAAILEDGRLTLTGSVGDMGFGEYFTHSQIVVALAQVEDDAELIVYINSGGGYVDDGAAIHALLSRRQGATNVVVDGMAASAASLIAMAGDLVTMSAGAVMMIHDPAQITYGNSDDHVKTIEQLEACAVSFARIYAAKSGKSAEECRAIMKAERWYSPDDAVSEGFADATSDKVAVPVAAFDYRIYAHAPKSLRAKASAKGWSASRASVMAAPPAETGHERTDMTDKERADQAEADLAALRAERDSDAAKAEKDELEAFRADKVKRENAEAVLALDEAKDRPKLAKALADQGMKAEAAKAVLTAAAKETPEASADEAGSDDEALIFGSQARGSGGKTDDAAAKAGWTKVATSMSHKRGVN